MKKLSTGKTDGAWPEADEYFYRDMGLESLFRTGVFLIDRDHDTIPDTRTYHIELPDDPYCRKAWELLENKLKGECGNGECIESRNVIRFTGNNAPSIRQFTHEGYTELHIEGGDEELVSFMQCLVRDYDRYELCASMEEITMHLRDTFSCRNSDGEAVYQIKHQDRCILEQEYPVQSELDTVMRLIDEVQTEDHGLEFELAVSKPKEVRLAVETEIHQRFPNAEVCVLNAYKQGFSWIEEVCLPVLKEKMPDRIVITFAMDGAWKDMDGRVPVRTSSKGNSSEEQMELPVRFLQELYPVDDVLAEALHMDRDKITFRLSEEPDITYRLSAYQDDAVVFTDTYTVRTYERYFLDEYTEKGTVHPSTGYFRIRQNGSLVMDQTVSTDRDHIYDVFQKKILPALKACRKSAHDNGMCLSQIVMKIGLDETERILPFRQDRISPADGLMEDLYFTALEYFAQNDLETGGNNGEAGLIIPDVTLRTGRPSCRLSVSAAEEMIPHDVRVRLDEVSYKDGRLVYRYIAEGVSDDVIRNWCSLCDNGKLRISEQLNGKGIFAVNGHEVRVCSEQTAYLDPAEIRIPDTVITPDMLDEVMEQFRHVRGIHVHVVGESYEHRPVYAVSFEEKTGSRYEDRISKVNVLINARHHANEVSSTNAVLHLIKELLCDPVKQALIRNMNLVIMPMENPDGAAVHELLSRKHPSYKLHMARFNALGREFARDVFVPDTVHTEARAVYRLMREYVFDAVIDEHGVPSHEWEQTFSGYTSPAYRGFWLPRAVLYGYFWYTPEHENEMYSALTERIEQAVSMKINADKELTELNNDWKDRFEKYAHAWMPAMFPADYRYDMIHYHIVRPQDDHSFYVTQKYPWLHALYYTSEVPDETVHGQALKQCVRAHLADEYALLEVIREFSDGNISGS